MKNYLQNPLKSLLMILLDFLFECLTLISKIKNTFDTGVTNSFSMYRYLTQAVDGIPEQTQRQDFKAFRLSS